MDDVTRTAILAGCVLAGACIVVALVLLVDREFRRRRPNWWLPVPPPKPVRSSTLAVAPVVPEPPATRSTAEAEGMDAYDLEAVFDEQIQPLISQVYALCQEHRIPMVAAFAYSSTAEEVGIASSLLNNLPGRSILKFAMVARLLSTETKLVKIPMGALLPPPRRPPTA